VLYIWIIVQCFHCDCMQDVLTTISSVLMDASAYQQYTSVMDTITVAIVQTNVTAVSYSHCFSSYIFASSPSVQILVSMRKSCVNLDAAKSEYIFFRAVGLPILG